MRQTNIIYYDHFTEKDFHAMQSLLREGKSPDNEYELYGTVRFNDIFIDLLPLYSDGKGMEIYGILPDPYFNWVDGLHLGDGSHEDLPFHLKPFPLQEVLAMDYAAFQQKLHDCFAQLVFACMESDDEDYQKAATGIAPYWQLTYDHDLFRAWEGDDFFSIQSNNRQLKFLFDVLTGFPVDEKYPLVLIPLDPDMDSLHLTMEDVSEFEALFDCEEKGWHLFIRWMEKEVPVLIMDVVDNLTELVVSRFLVFGEKTMQQVFADEKNLPPYLAEWLQLIQPMLPIAYLNRQA